MRMQKSRSWKAVRTLAEQLYGTAAVGTRNVDQLSAEQIAEILRDNEFTKEFQGNVTVKSYTTNQLAANKVLEDRSAEAKLLATEGSLYGVYDGHAGHKCAEVLSKRLFSYIALALLPETSRTSALYSRRTLTTALLENYRESHNEELGSEEAEVYDELRMDWLRQLIKTKQNYNRKDALAKAFSRMDVDLGRAAETGKLIEAAVSGAVACVALILGQDLFVAGTGDCGAVLGRQMPNGQWSALKLTTVHTEKNAQEVQRLKMEHPEEERKHIIQNGRLFGSLMPLRAFGDFIYKWPSETIEKRVAPIYGNQVIFPKYHTPPYLTATPDVTHVELKPEDKFLILGTDGLWDALSPEMVVQLVGDHQKQTPTTLNLNQDYYEFVFPQRNVQEITTMIPNDSYPNPSTYLLRAALGGSLNLVKRQLSVPLGEARMIRDDITVTVIFLQPNKTFAAKSGDLINSPSSATPNVIEESGSEKVNEPCKDKDGSIGHSEKWEDIETAATESEEMAEDVDLDAAVETGGIIGRKALKVQNESKKTGSRESSNIPKYQENRKEDNITSNNFK